MQSNKVDNIFGALIIYFIQANVGIEIIRYRDQVDNFELLLQCPQFFLEVLRGSYVRHVCLLAGKGR